MLNLLNPLGLVALAALCVPAAIHLWRFPRKTIRLGSLKFLEAVARPRLNQWRWRERLLLMLRLLLIAFLAVLLARPEWVRLPAKPMRWALLAPGVKLQGANEAEWNALLAEGYTAQPLASANLWSALREADARVAAGSDFVVFAPLRWANFQGARAELAHANVRWVEVPGTTPERWIESVTPSKEGRDWTVWAGGSEPTGTRFERAVVPAGTKRISVGGAEIDLPTAVVVTRPLSVVIFNAADRAEDAQAVVAAVRAVAATGDRAMTVTLNPGAGASAGADWIFLLGRAGPAAADLQTALERGANVVSDAGDAAASGRVSTFRSESGGLVSLWRRAGVAVGEVLKRDSFGEPVITQERVGRGRHFHFISRFNTQWTDWTGSTAFPEWIRGLLLGGNAGERDLRRDQRVISLDQAQAAVAKAGSLRAVIPEVMDLARACWWLAAGMFLGERLLSHFWTRRRGVEGVA